MSRPKRRRNGRVVRWIRVPRVWHWRGRRYIYRKDGKDFIFPVFGK